MAKKGGPGCVRRWWQIRWQRQRSGKTIRGEDVGKFGEKVGDTFWGGEEISLERRRRRRRRAKKTFWLATFKRRLCWQRKFAPRIGMETGAS